MSFTALKWWPFLNQCLPPTVRFLKGADLGKEHWEVDPVHSDVLATLILTEQWCCVQYIRLVRETKQCTWLVGEILSDGQRSQLLGVIPGSGTDLNGWLWASHLSSDLYVGFVFSGAPCGPRGLFMESSLHLQDQGLKLSVCLFTHLSNWNNE